MGDLDISGAHNSKEAFEAIANEQWDVIIADYQLKDKYNGIDVIWRALEKDPTVKTILLSGNCSFVDGQINPVSDRVLQKPIDPEELEAIIKELIREKQER
jgi:YesN/AraC family two-component response regulator